jgi:adenine-specific DNA-methyltransferase
MDKPSLIKKIKALDTLSNTEKADLIALLNNTKKYGLVWEDKPEDVELDLLTMLPVLQEVPQKRILASEIVQVDAPKADQKKADQSAGTVSMFPDEPQTSIGASLLLEEKVSKADEVPAPNHILIEGDNLHALTALTFTHEGKIDVMYFDPPYNTGNKDFKYNDRFVDKEDTYRHSKWLSFMHKRLQIAHRLLSEEGVIFISIDDNESANLKLLMDGIFGEKEFLGQLVRKTKSGGGLASNAFAIEHDYVITYCKNKLLVSKLSINHNEEYLKRYKEEDELGRFFWDTMERSSTQTKPYKIKAPDDQILTGKWFRNESRFHKDLEDGEIKFLKKDNGSWSVQFKQRLSDGTRIRSMLIDNTFRSSQDELIDLGMKDSFSYPKPINLIKTLSKSASNKSSIVLDIFAGSGTTLHATMALNAEDGGNRQCILVTNNENNICEEVTYERNKRVIQGFTNAKGFPVPGLTNNNLRYFKTGFIPSAKTETNRRLLTSASSELLQIKEDCYTNITISYGFDPEKCCICTNGIGKYLVIVFHSRRQQEVIGQLCRFIQDIPNLKEKVRVYAFSPETEVLVDDFYSVADKITAVPLPDAIYNAYRATFKTLKLEKKKFATIPGEQEVTSSDDSETDSQPELFDQSGEE